MTRSNARELLMQLLFQMEIQQDYSPESKNKYLAANPEAGDQLKYINQAFLAVTENMETIDETISRFSEKWKITRMPKVDLTILRLAVAEILYMKDIPKEVSINEAVNMAKKFSTEDGGRFVNGILGRVEKII